MSTAIQRSFRILEQLSLHPQGRLLSELATEIDVPLSATHRLLADLTDCGYVRKDPRHGEFTLTMKVASLGLRFLSASGITDVAQPALERLAARSGELVRLAVVDNDQLIFVAKAQGASHGLRYDPEMGQPVRLSCSAAGFAWLATKTEAEATELVVRQGFGAPNDFGPDAPTNIKELMTRVRATRKRGFSMTVDVFAPSMSSMAATVAGPQAQVSSLLIIAGPAARLTRERMLTLGPALLETADELKGARDVSPMMNRPSTHRASNGVRALNPN